MLRRKLFTFILGSFFSIFLITLGFMISEGESIGMFFFVSYFAAPAILLYGIPVSVFSEFLTKKYEGKSRRIRSFMIHITFGMSFIFLAGILFDSQYFFEDVGHFWRSNQQFFYAATVSSIVFWAVDEILRLYPSLNREY